MAGSVPVMGGLGRPDLGAPFGCWAVQMGLVSLLPLSPPSYLGTALLPQPPKPLRPPNGSAQCWPRGPQSVPAVLRLASDSRSGPSAPALTPWDGSPASQMSPLPP